MIVSWEIMLPQSLRNIFGRWNVRKPGVPISVFRIFKKPERKAERQGAKFNRFRRNSLLRRIMRPKGTPIFPWSRTRLRPRKAGKPGSRHDRPLRIDRAIRACRSFRSATRVWRPRNGIGTGPCNPATAARPKSESSRNRGERLRGERRRPGEWIVSLLRQDPPRKIPRLPESKLRTRPRPIRFGIT